MLRPIPFIAAALLAFAVTSPSRAAPAPDPLPSQQTIRDAYAGGQHAQVLQMLGRVLALKGKAAEGYDRHELLRTKGEAHLRTKPAGAVAAAQAFGEASKVAPDGPAAALDIATELLLKRANAGLAYQPKQKDPADKTKALPPVGVVEAEERKKAIEHLYADELAAAEPKVRAAKDGRALPPILEALPTVRTVRWLEMAATGSDGKSQAMVGELVAKAQKLLDEALKEMQASTEEIELNAVQVVDVRVPVRDPQTGKTIGLDTKFRRRGPTERQFGTLRNTVATCVKIHKSCDELGGTLGATGKEFEPVKAQAEQVGTRAKKMVDANWRQVYDTPPR